MKTAKFFISFLLAILFVGLSTADAQEKYVKVYDSLGVEVAIITPDCDYVYEYTHELKTEEGLVFATEVRVGKVWMEVDSKSGKGEIHITCNQSIDGQTFYRNDLGDTFVLHYSGETGVWDWEWFDSGGWFAGEPDQTTTLAGDFVDGVLYDQSSTEPGYSYGVIFYIADPQTPTTYDATFTVTDESTTDPISGASVTVTGVGTQSTNASGQVTFVDLTDGVYTYTVDAPGYAAVSGNFTVAGDDVTVNVQLPDPYNVLFQVIGTNSSPVEGAEVYLDGYGTLVTDGSGEVEFVDVINGTFDYTVTADGYHDANGSVTVDGGSETEIVSLSPTAIDDVVGSNISIYPNPVTTTLFIKDANEFESLSIYDVNGRVIYSSEVDGDITVDFTEFTNGIYFVKLTSNKKTYCCKISKQ